ncbi:TPA: AAA family ATPase [Streptococcus agalactiae]|nr:ATP-dependent Clp protease ATP-binding subunit [Streptococcus agalactiae]HEO7770330.1 ATP-dependent Clp protease ATP-binding subunit [Streptococcus agalactiae]
MALKTATQYQATKLEPRDIVSELQQNENFMSSLKEYSDRINGGVNFLEPLDVTYVGDNVKVKQTIQVLEMKRNPVCMVMADAGEGKTTMVKHLMQVVNRQEVGLNLENYYVIFKMSVTHIKSLGLDKLEREMEEMLHEMKKLEDIAIRETGIKNLKFVTFFDESHKLIRIFGTQSKQGGDTLKESLTPAEVKVICATTRLEYDRTIATDEPLEDRFELVELNKTSESQLSEIIKNTWSDFRKKPPYYPIDNLSEELIINIMYYTKLLMPNKNEPRRSTKFIERLESKCRTENRQPSLEVVKELFAEKRLSTEPKLNINAAIDHIHSDLIGQELAKSQMTDSLFAQKVKIKSKRGHRPIGVYFFAGPTGVGKTECAKILNNYLLSTPNIEEKDIIYIRVPDYAADPDGGRKMLAKLGRAVKHNPESVILIDEYEKGVPNNQNKFLKTNLQPLFLHLTDEGIVQWEEIDSEGLEHEYIISLANTIMIFTSNAGYETFENEDKTGDTFEYATISEAEAVAKRNQLVGSIKKRFYEFYNISREFLGRMDNFVVFTGLGEYNATLLTEKILTQYFKDYEIEYNIRVHLKDKHLYQKEYIEGMSEETEFQELSVFVGKTKADMKHSSSGGARQVRNTISAEIEGKMGRALYYFEKEQVENGYTEDSLPKPTDVYLDVDDHGLDTRVTKAELILQVRYEIEN